MTPTFRPFTLLLPVVLCLGCGSKPELNVESSSDAPEPAAMQSAHATETASAPSELPVGHPALSDVPPEIAANVQPGDLPAGHPAVATPATRADVLPPVDAGAGTGATALGWTSPADWIAEAPANTMRRAQWRVPGPGGDGECIVFYFGPGQGGDAMANAERWASQFTDGSGQPAMASMKTRTETVDGIPVLFVEAAGIYQSGSMMGMGQVVAKPDWALLGAVAEGPDANWFFKLTGPRPTVEAQRAGFEAMLRSLKRGG